MRRRRNKYGRFEEGLERLLPWRGASVPTTRAAAGDRFRHSPAGRSLDLGYDGAAWQPLVAYGTTTVYVDGASGTDAQDKGTGTGAAAYRTIQYAWNQLAFDLAGNATINIAAGTYREAVTFQGRTPRGNYTITVVGAETTDLAATAFNSAANGGGNGAAGFGTVTKTAAGWTVNAYQNKYVAIEGTGTGNGQVYLVHSNTADTITVVGRWATVPGTANNTLRVWSHGTRLTGADAGAETTPVRQYAVRLRGGQRGVTLSKLKIDYAGLGANREAPLLVLEQSSCDVTHCRFQGGNLWNVQVSDASRCGIEYSSSLNATVAGIYCEYGSTVPWLRFFRSSADATGVLTAHSATVFELRSSYIGSSTGAGIAAQYGSGVSPDAYLEVDAAGSDGIQVTDNSYVQGAASFGAVTTIRVQNSTGWGLFASTGGIGANVQTFTYTANASGTYTPVTSTAGGTS